MTKYIEESLYRAITENAIVVCVDVLAKYKDQFVLIKRKTEPMKDVFWPIGGRILQTELYYSAAERKLCEEANITKYYNLRPIGIYEDIFDKSSFSDNTVYHTLSIAFECDIYSIDEIKLDDTSSEWKLSTELPERFRVKSFL
jgi:ADP-ribose pyrophosphatase YjhB (NUDIX family)